MNELNFKEVASALERNISTFPLSYHRARKMPVCSRPFRAAPPLPARPCRQGQSRLTNSRKRAVFGPTAKKVVIPCLAALVFGKTLSYVVELCGFIFFMLR